MRHLSIFANIHAIESFGCFILAMRRSNSEAELPLLAACHLCLLSSKYSFLRSSSMRSVINYLSDLPTRCIHPAGLFNDPLHPAYLLSPLTYAICARNEFHQLLWH